MDNPTKKGKSKKAAKTTKSNTKKQRKSGGPSCSMFLAELTRRFHAKKKELPESEETSNNIVQTIIESITNALPIKFSRRSPSIKDSPIKIETLQTFAPELVSSDTIEVQQHENVYESESTVMTDANQEISKSNSYKMPKLPIIDSRVFKERRRVITTEDASVNTGPDHDFASELTRHVGTLKRISLIAEEFNQKTAKNLKEIVDSVQDDLIKKLEEVKAEKERALRNSLEQSNTEPSTSAE